MAANASSLPLKPRLRGVLHQYAAFLAVGAGAWLVQAAQSPRARKAALIYVVCLTALYVASATYHRTNFRCSPKLSLWLRRIDHAAIFLFIAGTYTPVCLILPPDRARLVLGLVWGGAALGILRALFWVHAPRAVTVPIYLLVGWVMLPFIGDFYAALGPGPLTLIGLGGVFYTSGASVYARQRPDP